MTTLHKDLVSVISDNKIPWEKLDGSSVLVTGATGLIGSLVIKTLLELKFNINIYALVRDLKKAKSMLGDKVEFVLGDIREPLELNQPIDYLFHCAAVTTSKYMITNPVETLSVAIKGTENVLEFAKKRSIKSMVYLSSMEVYGTIKPEENPITENKLGYLSLENPRSSYPEGKRITELMCSSYFSQYGVPVKTARLAQTFGAGIPLSDNRAPMQFARSVINQKDITLHTTGESMTNFCYTADTLRGLFTILFKGENGQAYNVCNDGESRRIKEVAELVAKQVSGGKIKLIFDIPESNVHGYAPDSSLQLSSQKLNSLGWKAEVDMIEAYRRLISYLEEKNRD